MEGHHHHGGQCCVGGTRIRLNNPLRCALCTVVHGKGVGCQRGAALAGRHTRARMQHVAHGCVTHICTGMVHTAARLVYCLFGPMA